MSVLIPASRPFQGEIRQGSFLVFALPFARLLSLLVKTRHFGSVIARMDTPKYSETLRDP